MEASEEFCLRWNNHQQNLRTTMAEQYKNQTFTDVTLGVEDGHSIQCHKMILAASSRYFQSILIDFPYEHPIVVLNDVKYKEIMAILEYMYKGEVNVPGNELAALFKVAEALEIKGLVGENKRFSQPEVANRRVIDGAPEIEKSDVNVYEERASAPSPASSPHWLTGKFPATSEYERAKLSTSAWSAFSQALASDIDDPMAAASLRSSLSARYSPLLGFHCDSGMENYPRKRRMKKMSSGKATINRGGTTLLRTSLDQSQALGGSSGDAVPIVRHDSHYRIASNGGSAKNDCPIDSRITRTPDLVSETWMVDEDESRASRRSSSEETNPVTANAGANCGSSHKPGAAKRYKQYTHTDIAGAIAAVLENGMSANKAAVMFRVPSRTLYDKISRVKKEEELRNGEASTSKRKRNTNSSGASFPSSASLSSGGSATTGSVYGNYSDTPPTDDEPASLLETTFAESRDNFIDRDAAMNVDVKSPNPRLSMDSQASHRIEETDNEAEDLSLSRKSDVTAVMPTRFVIKEAV